MWISNFSEMCLRWGIYPDKPRPRAREWVGGGVRGGAGGWARACMGVGVGARDARASDLIRARGCMVIL